MFVEPSVSTFASDFSSWIVFETRTMKVDFLAYYGT